jgi:hypothetical protein
MNINRVRTFCFLAALACFVMPLMACGVAAIDTTFTTVIAVMEGIGIVLATIGTLLLPAESAAIQAAVTLAVNAVQALKSAVDAYETNKTGSGLEAAINAALASVKTNLASLLAAAKIENPTLQAWITNVVNLISNVVTEVETDIIPNLATMKAEYEAGNTAPVEALNVKFKAIAAKLKADNDVLIANSGLPPAAIAAATKHVHDRLARHIGPVRI